MPTTDEQVHIDRPVAEVFAYAVDPANQTTVQSALLEFTGEQPQKGSTMQGVTRVAGKKISWTAEVTEIIENERFEIRSVEAPMDFHIVWTFSESDGGTDVTFHQDTPSLGGFFGKMGDALVTGMYNRDVRGNLANLKDLLEA